MTDTHYLFDAKTGDLVRRATQDEIDECHGGGMLWASDGYGGGRYYYVDTELTWGDAPKDE